MTPELRAAVENAYEVFAPYTDVYGGKHLDVCRCPCCMYEHAEHELLNTPLREITPSNLAEYTNSAHGWDDTGIAYEFRYFLPRYLELMAQYNPPTHGSGLRLCLSRMGEASWLSKWPEPQVACVQRFFDAFLRASLLDLGHQVPGGSAYDRLDIEDVLLCIHYAGGDFERALRVWDEAPDPGAAANMAVMAYCVTWVNGVPTVHGWDHSAAMRTRGERLAAFLRRPEVAARIEAAFFMTDDENWQSVLSDALFLLPRREA